MTIAEFRRTILFHYDQAGRHNLPWRKTRDPYKILVSEIMLQQTQVDRVTPKYLAFVKRFPNVASLAAAPFAEVLGLWSGLGYNRRALFLHRAAKAVVADFEGTMPKDRESLLSLPGVGPYTASAVATFAYDHPQVFIETNIRSVFIHAFFPNDGAVSDRDILVYIERALPADHFRQWYWALMDYGAYIKKAFGNPSRKSAHHAKQSPFEGSLRKIRGALIRTITKRRRMSREELIATCGQEERARVELALSGLEKDGLVRIDTKGFVSVAA